MPRARCRWNVILGLFMIAMAGSRTAGAHGGLSLEKDMCKLRAGPYTLHFSGYQPDKQGNKEFCEDIPETGQTIVVMDEIEDILRDLPVEVRILRDTGRAEPLETDTVVHLPAKVYPHGTITIRHAFEEKGNFVGLVTVGNDPPHISRFPFSVGYGDSLWARHGVSIFFVVAIVGLGAGLLRYSAKKDTRRSGSGRRVERSDRGGEDGV